MKPKLLIKGSQEIVDITINQGESINQDIFYKNSNLRAVLSTGDDEKDVTDKFLKVDLSSLENLQKSENFIIPWSVKYNDRLLQEGDVQVRVLVKEDHPIINDYKVKDDGFQILLNKGVSIPKGYRKLPNINWLVEFPGFKVESFNVFFVTNKNHIMHVDYSHEFDSELKDSQFTAEYKGGLINFDGVDRAGVAYILTLTSEEEDDDELEYDIVINDEIDSFTPTVQEGESAINQVLDNMVSKVSNVVGNIKNKKANRVDNEEKNIVKDKDSEKQIVKRKSTSKKQTQVATKDKKIVDKSSKNVGEVKSNKWINILLTIAITALIGLGTIYGVNKYKDSTLASIQDEVQIIKSNQESAYNILNKRTLSDEDINQLDKLLNQNQKMINDMNSNNIFIAQERNELAEYNNALVTEAKIKFDKQTE